jgi:hypothetical protein
MPTNTTDEKTIVHASVYLPIPLHNELIKMSRWTGLGRSDLMRAGVIKFLDELFITMDGYELDGFMDLVREGKAGLELDDKGNLVRWYAQGIPPIKLLGQTDEEYLAEVAQYMKNGNQERYYPDVGKV